MKCLWILNIHLNKFTLFSTAVRSEGEELVRTDHCGKRAFFHTQCTKGKDGTFLVRFWGRLTFWNSKKRPTLADDQIKQEKKWI
jgi:hypothetical protein